MHTDTEKKVKLDAMQQKAVDAKRGYYLVLAPPGCGKTEILAERIYRAIESGVDAGEILCLTFTNRASRNMRDRINKMVVGGGSEVFIGNVHRFCSKFIFDYGCVSEDTSIVDESDQTDLFTSFSPQYFTVRSQPNRQAVNEIDKLASYITQMRLGHHPSVAPEDDGYRALYAEALRGDFDYRRIPDSSAKLQYALRYLEYKKRHNLIDFSDILILAYDYMLKHNDYKKYSWIQIDEVQDLNPLQLAIVDCLTGMNPTVMYLGDEQQAIFSFMGAKLSLLKELKKRCRPNLLHLNNNYRSPKYIIDICNGYAEAELGVDRSLLPESNNSGEQSRHDVILTESISPDAEGERMLKMVEYYLSLDDKERLAILVTRNRQADEISNVLSANGIPNFRISGTDMFKTTSYKTLSSVFGVAANDHNAMAWARLLFGAGGVHTLAEAHALVARLKETMMTPSDIFGAESYLERFVRIYREEEIVMFDTETTGLNVMEDDIVQIAAFKVRCGRRIEGSDFNIIMHTDREIPAKLGELTNPLVEEYAGREHVGRAEGLRMFMQYVGDRKLLGHNVMYDYNILRNNIRRELHIDVEYDVYDSLHIIKCVEPHMRRYKLGYLIEQLGLAGENSHLADEDIAATLSLVDYCVAKAAPVIAAQRTILDEIKIKNTARRMLPVWQMIVELEQALGKSAQLPGNSLHDHLESLYRRLLEINVIKDQGEKFNIFLRYVAQEWSETENVCLGESLSKHACDLMSSINEGDLVNSDSLISDRVFIMTVYKGKGLEFDNVVVLGANNGTYPYFTVNKVLDNPHKYTDKEYQTALTLRQEDARKFYVAISRAKKRLCVSYTRYNDRGYIAGCTPFIRSIKKYFTFGRHKG